MLSQHTPVATLPASDLSRARSFYEGTLGLSTEREDIGGITYTCGNGKLFLYESSYAGTNKATAVSFDVPASAFQEEVDALRARGVEFTTFDAEGMTWNDGVASMGESIQAVWFTDPDGNILNISAGEMS
jgi:catechol-2,3-dioxygenase